MCVCIEWQHLLFDVCLDALEWASGCGRVGIQNGSGAERAFKGRLFPNKIFVDERDEVLVSLLEILTTWLLHGLFKMQLKQGQTEGSGDGDLAESLRASIVIAASKSANQ